MIKSRCESPGSQSTWQRCGIAPLCGKCVEIGSGKLPPDYYETCRLREYMIGLECIAYLDIGRALRLLAGGASADTLSGNDDDLHADGAGTRRKMASISPF